MQNSAFIIKKWELYRSCIKDYVYVLYLLLVTIYNVNLLHMNSTFNRINRNSYHPHNLALSSFFFPFVLPDWLNKV